jgi:hypothetical protein
MKKVFASAIALMAGTFAFSQANVDVTTQSGTLNMGLITQVGSANNNNLLQNGFSNMADIKQTGGTNMNLAKSALWQCSGSVLVRKGRCRVACCP